MKVHYLVYKLTNLVNGKIYIGCHMTKNLDDDYMGSGRRLGYAKKKYGIENFKKEILSAHETPEEMLAEEARLVNEEFLGRDDVYNLTVGGKGSWFHTNQLPKMRKIRQCNINKSRSNFFENCDTEKWRSIQSEKMKNLHSEGKCRYDTFSGKTHSEESKQKIGKANSLKQAGSKNSQFGSKWMNKNGEVIKVQESEVVKFELEGWKFGRKP